jgi:excisionase family DNA binding protein
LKSWRSREKWVSRATTTGWMHKHPYPRSLDIKAILPQSQTLPIAPAAREVAVVAVPLRNPKHPTAPARARKQPAVINSKTPLTERRPPRHRLDHRSRPPNQCSGAIDNGARRRHRRRASSPPRSPGSNPASRTSGKRQKRPASKAASRTTSTDTRYRPVTMSVNVADGRPHHGRALPKYYAIKAVAEALDVSARTVRRWIANGDLIAHRVDRVARVADTDLRTFLALRREG